VESVSLPRGRKWLGDGRRQRFREVIEIQKEKVNQKENQSTVITRSEGKAEQSQREYHYQKKGGGKSRGGVLTKPQRETKGGTPGRP